MKGALVNVMVGRDHLQSCYPGDGMVCSRIRCLGILPLHFSHILFKTETAIDWTQLVSNLVRKTAPK